MKYVKTPNLFFKCDDIKSIAFNVKKDKTESVIFAFDRDVRITINLTAGSGKKMFDAVCNFMSDDAKVIDFTAEEEGDGKE